MAEPVTPPPPGRRLLRCDACGRAAVCPSDDLLRYTREGWPNCCGRVMALFAEAEKPSAAGPPTPAPTAPPPPPMTVSGPQAPRLFRLPPDREKE